MTAWLCTGPSIVGIQVWDRDCCRKTLSNLAWKCRYRHVGPQRVLFLVGPRFHECWPSFREACRNPEETSKRRIKWRDSRTCRTMLESWDWAQHWEVSASLRAPRTRFEGESHVAYAIPHPQLLSCSWIRLPAKRNEFSTTVTNWLTLMVDVEGSNALPQYPLDCTARYCTNFSSVGPR